MPAASDILPLREPSAWRRWLWPLWAGMICMILTASAALLATRVMVPSQLSYPGILRSSLRQTDVDLPQSVPLKKLLVQEGETVKAGQTLAVFDTDLIAEQLDEAERRILADNILRRCLISAVVPRDSELPAGGLDPETALLTERAASECAALLNRHDVQARRIAMARSAVEVRFGARIRRLKSAAARISDSERRNRLAMQIAVERNGLAPQTGKLDLELAALSSDQEQEILAQVKRLEAAVARQRAVRAALRQALDQPRLHAPMAGEVARLRPVGAGQSFPQPVTLVSLQDRNSYTLNASFSVPEGEASTLSPGDPVILRLSGIRDGFAALNAPVLFKEPLDLRDDGRRVVRVHLDLTGADLSGLPLDMGGKGVDGGNTASEVRVSRPDQRLSGILLRTARQLLSDGLPI